MLRTPRTAKGPKSFLSTFERTMRWNLRNLWDVIEPPLNALEVPASREAIQSPASEVPSQSGRSRRGQRLPAPDDS